jgi:hypothetical protein
MSSSPHPGGPRLRLRGSERPARFTDMFTSRYIDTGELGLHAVIGGDGRRCCGYASGPGESSGEVADAG